MKNKEKQLFKQLCNFQSESFDTALLEYATPHVLGQLFYNKMQGVAYGTLKKHELREKVNSKFKNLLQEAYMQNLENNKSFFDFLESLSRILSQSNCAYALMNDALMYNRYSKGYQSYNKIDLLVLPENVWEIGNTLENSGFHQVYIQNGKVRPDIQAHNRFPEVTWGETVQYIKETQSPGIPFFEVNINFMLDFKNGNKGNPEKIQEILNRVKNKNISGLHFPCMDNSDFFIYLCAQLYKRITIQPWEEMYKDMTLCKYADIYLLLSEMTEIDINAMFYRASELGTEKICSLIILQTAAFFDVANICALKNAEQHLHNALCLTTKTN